MNNARAAGELVRSVFHEGVSNPTKARIKVEKWEWEGLYIPMTCRQCADAPCMNVCDLCDGNPQCVRFCDMKAVDYIDPRRESTMRKRDAALKVAEAKKLGAAAEYEGRAV